MSSSLFILCLLCLLCFFVLLCDPLCGPLCGSFQVLIERRMQERVNFRRSHVLFCHQHHTRIGSARVEVLERGRDVVFLHRVVPGGADRSYGIQVARLAGVPAEITARAEELLLELESDGRSAHSSWRPATSEQRLAFEIVDQLRGLDVPRLTPVQALARLEAWQAMLGAHPNAT